MDCYTRRPSVSQSSSTASTLSTASLDPSFASLYAMSFPTSFHNGSAAPMPSPTVEQGQYFVPLSVYQQQAQQQQLQLQQEQQQRLMQEQYNHAMQLQQYQLQCQQSQQQHRHHHHHQGGGVHPPQRQASTSSTDSEASLHLKDFSLIAEAAKRAQVACVTRDLEEFGF